MDILGKQDWTVIKCKVFLSWKIFKKGKDKHLPGMIEVYLTLHQDKGFE